MGSKILVLLALSAFVLLISSEVAARELAENESTKTTEGAGVDGHYGGGGSHYGGGGSHYGGGGSHYGGGGSHYGGGGGGGHHGGGGGGCHHGYCHGRCCKYAGEEVQDAAEVKPQN